VVTLQQLLLRFYPWLFAWCHLKKNRPTAPDGSSFAHYWITEPWYWRQAWRARIFEKIRMDRDYPLLV
jgi:hypothetical protein